MNLTDIVNADKELRNSVTQAAETSMGCSSCRKDSSMSAFPAETPVGMAYVPYQQWKNIYEPAVGIDRGTIFEDLDKPFLGERAV